MTKRNVALLGLIAFAAACGGSNESQTDSAAAPATETAAPAATPEAAAPAATPAAGGTVHEVHVTTTQNGASGAFEPATLTVKKGDIVRFISTGAPMHNVSFPASENAGKTGLPADSPFMQDGQPWDLQITMEPGTYNYICVPHAAMGMKGSITVE